MIYYKNRYLSEKLNIGLAKWKRWVREFLPTDPLSGRQSGYARQLNLGDAFKVYFGGHLVSELKFSIPQAQQILFDLGSWFEKHGYCNHHIDQLPRAADDSPHDVVMLINIDRGGIAYVIRNIIRFTKSDDKSICSEEFAETLIGIDPQWCNNTAWESARLISISNICANFVRMLLE